MKSNAVSIASLGVLFGFAISLASSTGCGESPNASASANSPGNAGANGEASNTATGTAATERRTAQQILKEMEATYRKATSYSDAAQVRLHFERDGKAYEDKLDFSISFVRPNKLRLICYDAMAVSDGAQFRAAVKSIPNLVLQVAAPKSLTVDDVVKDPQLRAALVQGPGGPPVQLPFLLADNTLNQLLQDAMQPPKLVQPEAVEGRWCNRIEIDGAEGTLTLWIDQQSNLIRRIVLPTREFKKQLEQESPVTNVSLVIEFHQAQLNQPINDTAFKFEVPEGAKIVEALVEEVPPAVIAARTEPANLKLTKLWTATDVKDPGNVLVIEGAAGAPKILVFDGWRTVTEVDSAGKVVARHELDIPADAVLSFLRTATDAQGKRYYVASANGQPQCHVFDENWRRVVSYPRPEDGPSEGIGDVQLVDLAGTGKPILCVSYWGEVGVQGAALDGSRLWRDRSLQFVLRTAATHADPQGHRNLLCTHSRGNIVPFNFEGKPEKEIVIPNRHVYYIASGDLEGPGQYNYCALAGSIVNDSTAIGISLDGKELWNYPLPPGVHGRPIEVIATGDVAGDAAREWIIAGSDGSVHVIGADGKPIDKFNTGGALTGLGAARLGNQRVLLVSTVLEKPDGDRKGALEAWLVESK